jgi:hypothetical protein
LSFLLFTFSPHEGDRKTSSSSESGSSSTPYRVEKKRYTLCLRAAPSTYTRLFIFDAFLRLKNNYDNGFVALYTFPFKLNTLDLVLYY